MTAADHDTRSLPALTPVTFDGDQIFYLVRGEEQLVPVRPVCDVLGLAWKPQFVKLTTERDRWSVTMMVTVAADGSMRDMLCLPLSRLFGWLATISPSRVKPELRDKLVRYQRECDRVLAAHFLGQRQAETDQDVIDAWAKTNYELLERLGRALEERAAAALHPGAGAPTPAGAGAGGEPLPLPDHGRGNPPDGCAVRPGLVDRADCPQGRSLVGRGTAEAGRRRPDPAFVGGRPCLTSPPTWRRPSGSSTTWNGPCGRWPNWSAPRGSTACHAGWTSSWMVWPTSWTGCSSDSLPDRASTPLPRPRERGRSSLRRGRLLGQPGQAINHLRPGQPERQAQPVEPSQRLVAQLHLPPVPSARGDGPSGPAIVHGATIAISDPISHAFLSGPIYRLSGPIIMDIGPDNRYIYSINRGRTPVPGRSVEAPGHRARAAGSRSG